MKPDQEKTDSPAAVSSTRLLCVQQLACPTCGSRAWRSDWGAMLWAKCEGCGTVWKHTRRADEICVVITPSDIGMNDSMTSAML